MLSPELQQALKLHQSGRYQEAETIYRRAIAQQPDHPVVPHLLGVLAAQTGRFDEANDLLRKATERQPRNPEVFNDIGGLAAMLGRLAEAETWLRKAIAIAPTHLGAMANLAKVLQQQKRLSEAEVCAKMVLRAAPDRGDMLNVLAIGHYYARRLLEAEQACCEGLAKAPNDADLHNTLGLVLRDMHRLDEAVAAFERAIALQPKNSLPLFNLGICHHQRDAHAAAEQCFRGVLARQPENAEAKYALAEAIICQGRTAEGRAILDELLARHDRHWMARWSRLLALPVVYESQAQMDEVRADYRRQLTALEADIAAHLTEDTSSIVAAVRYKTPFLLHYQGYKEVELQGRFGRLVTHVAEAAYPQYAKPLSRRLRPSGMPVRVGFASSFLYSHSMTKTHGAWIMGLPRDRFDVSLFHLHTKADETTEQLKRNATYHACGALSEEELIARVVGARLDALIWLDIGMEQKAQVPSALRLAPIQATTLGHPMTTGLPNMDFFLSSDLMEPPDGESDYTERLVRLPNLSVSYPRPPAHLGSAPALLSRLKSEGRILYLCAQSLFKLVPRNDAIFVALAHAVPLAVFIFVGHDQAAATEIFRKRIHAAFEAAGLDPRERIHILPRLSQEQFFAVNRSADVVLDSMAWAGFNSTMEAIACDRPVVTLPGNTMRARHAFGVLRMLELDELIARDEADYVAIAARLGTDTAWRQDMTDRIAARKNRLYGDAAPIAALSAWLDAVTRDEAQDESWIATSTTH